MGAVVLGDHHQPGGVLVEPVHDAGPPHAADAREAVAAMGDQRIDQGPVPWPAAGMNHQVARLVDDDHVVVLVDDIERDLLGRGLGRSGGGTLTTIASPELTRWPGSRIVRPSIATAPASISAFSRERDNSANPRREHAVEPFAGFRPGDQ